MSDKGDQRPPGKFRACRTCGGTGVDSVDMDQILGSKLRKQDVGRDIRELWERQFTFRPRLHAAVDTYLSYRVVDRLGHGFMYDDLFDQMAILWENTLALYDSAMSCKAKDQGRILIKVTDQLFTIFCVLDFFLAHHGRHNRTTVARLLERQEMNTPDGGDVDLIR